MKHFLLLGVKSVRITKIENNVDFPSFPFVPYSDVGTDNCANTSLSSDSAKLKLSRCYNHVNLKIRSGLIKKIMIFLIFTMTLARF